MNLRDCIQETIKNNIDIFFNVRKKQLDYWRHWSNSGGKIIVFGAALMGEKICTCLEELGVEVGFLCDNDSNKWGTEFLTPQNRRIAVVSPQKACGDGNNVFCFIAAGVQFLDEIKRQLVENNVKNIFSEQYPDFYLEAMTLFLNMDKEDVLQKTNDLLNMFEDEESLKVIWCHLKEIFGIKEDGGELSKIDFESLCIQPQYFFDGGKYLGKQEIMVDCGAYIGDTISSLVEDIRYDDYREYVCFELDKQNYKELRAVVDKMPERTASRIKTFNCGVGRNREWIRYNYNGGNSSVMNNGNLMGEIIPLDEMFCEKQVTFLKMDIEGSEQEALSGAVSLIRNKKPICAICIYHSIQDLFEIPMLLKRFVPEYSMIVRHHSTEWCDTVCYAKTTIESNS